MKREGGRIFRERGEEKSLLMIGIMRGLHKQDTLILTALSKDCGE